MLILAAAAPLWRTIDQPVAIKGLVAMVGLLLIAWQLWRFLGRHGGGVAARESEAGLQEITIIVDGGYAPSRIKVKAGQPIRLAFHRIDPSSCVAQVIFPDFHKTLDLPLEAIASLELPPQKPASIPSTAA
jgi:plastocyanin domain-containing protein